MQYNEICRKDYGLPVKRNYHMSFYQQLINEIDSLIRCKGEYIDECFVLSFDDLTEDEQAELVVLQLEDDERDTYDCFHDDSQYAKDDPITCALIKMLKNKTPDNQEDLAELIFKQCINRYRKTLSDLIEDRCGWVTQDFHDNRGFDE